MWTALLITLACAATPSSAAPTAHSVEGLTISTPTWGVEWGSDAMADTLRDWRDQGGTWVAIHPYASIDTEGHVRSRHWDDEDPPDWLVRPIEEAHALGLQVMIKPHLAYWGSGFSWRGAIHFEEEQARTRFFAEYQHWLRRLATTTKAADAFVIGTELDQLLPQEQSWREVITEVREVFPGHLTYAANWDQAERVPFWDALDAVGVQAYHPLAASSSPSRSQLEAGWSRVLDKLRALHQRTGKPVVLTELGYPRSAVAARAPWTAGDQGERFAELQAMCLDVALEAVAQEPAVVGAFLWKAFPGRRAPRDFSVQTPAMRAVIARHWGDDGPGG